MKTLCIPKKIKNTLKGLKRAVFCPKMFYHTITEHVVVQQGEKDKFQFSSDSNNVQISAA